VLLASVATMVVAAPAAGSALAPRISIDPASGPPGSTVTVTGQDFCAADACSSVQIQIYGVPVTTDIAVTASGTFTAQAKIPGGPSGGEIGVIAIQEIADGSESRAFAQFQVVIANPSPPITPPGPAPSAPSAPPETGTTSTPSATSDGPGSTSPQAGSQPDGGDGDGAGAWAWLAALVGLAAAGTVAVFLIRRRSSTSSSSPT
jgi:hypothetical protein